MGDFCTNADRRVPQLIPAQEYVQLVEAVHDLRTALLALSASGLDAAKPAADSVTAGTLYFATDVAGGTLYRSDGATWAAVAPGVSGGGSLEVGTFDPVLRYYGGGGGAFGVADRYGCYRKIGTLAIVNWYFKSTAITTESGAISITALPYKATTGLPSEGALGHVSDIGYLQPIQAAMVYDDTRARLKILTATGGSPALEWRNLEVSMLLGGPFEMSGTLVYATDS